MFHFIFNSQLDKKVLYFSCFSRIRTNETSSIYTALIDYARLHDRIALILKKKQPSKTLYQPAEPVWIMTGTSLARVRHFLIILNFLFHFLFFFIPLSSQKS